MTLKYIKLTSDILQSEPGLEESVTTSFYERIIEGNIPIAPVQPLDTKCWLWTGAKDGAYSRFTITKEGIVYTRRGNILSYIIHTGPTNGQMVVHLCQEKLCVRPEHLILGDASINGIHATLNRENPSIFNRSWKLRTSQVKQIRDLYFNFHFTLLDLSKLFEVSQSTISNVVNRKTFTQV